MKRTMIVTIAVLAAAVLAGMLLAFISDRQESAAVGQAQSVAVPPAQSAQPIASAAPQSQPDSSAAPPESVSPAQELPQGYVVGEYQGWLAVFPTQGSRPSMVYDVLVRSLPEYDRTRLEEGISAADDAELRRILEDYVS